MGVTLGKCSLRLNAFQKRPFPNFRSGALSRSRHPRLGRAIRFLENVHPSVFQKQHLASPSPLAFGKCSLRVNVFQKRGSWFSWPERSAGEML
jgi:hypothetical protein